MQLNLENYDENRGVFMVQALKDLARGLDSYRCERLPASRSCLVPTAEKLCELQKLQDSNFQHIRTPHILAKVDCKEQKKKIKTGSRCFEAHDQFSTSQLAVCPSRQQQQHPLPRCPSCKPAAQHPPHHPAQYRHGELACP